MPPPAREAPLGDRARHAVCRALARQARLYPEFDLSALDRTLEAETPPLSALDAAFAHAVYDAAIRNWLLLRFLLSRCVSQPFDELEPRLRGVLIAAAAQIILLDRVPVHAVINHAVEWAKRVIRPGAGGMTNAVLRKLALFRPPDEHRRRERYSGAGDEIPIADGGAIVLSEGSLPVGDIDRISIATGHPTALLEHWLKYEPIAEVRRVALHGVCQPPIILNTAHAESPVSTDHPLTPHSTPGHHVFEGSAAALAELLRARTDIWAQDPASAQPIRDIAHLRPALILDLCAGQGTKTRQLAATFPNSKIAATDIDDARFATLSEAFRGNSRVSVLPPKQLRETLLAKADLILLDVPCSNTGVLARRPEAKYRFGPETLKSLVSVQKQIIADCIPLLAESPRGKILYCTCSLEPEENHQQAVWVDRWHRLGISRERSQRPTGLPGEPPQTYADGSYAVLLG